MIAMGTRAVATSSVRATADIKSPTAVPAAAARPASPTALSPGPEAGTTAGRSQKQGRLQQAYQRQDKELR